ncbi:hypothetical protein A3J90_04745 [candidate division WOR-1 bacterium RIFOXYC2_FULL_37_10]|uniref:Uncharacterized protein n=1 Tax=candidate division WOR-1 bacterium RIFOXYB2_FULL_37_13 TaxID=1802579 RepID=A0A1F4SVG5_UNCSA|nr:MAG: hypothetical protein A2246_03095 [candidate division WOR-1 bacterium RIFOXYA2_FULL_37_7]OGC24434.1 MAG: hypothetical protein A2310_08515 [candidate division WOR-1 bacterium RIFOXYB2_FULL_37_13]OGC35532.1 MAG: hypothetical protein A3J90_04745 [candidate division WOR-1 bacterium RIFOXYC2_FULL_37_10]
MGIAINFYRSLKGLVSSAPNVPGSKPDFCRYVHFTGSNVDQKRLRHIFECGLFIKNGAIGNTTLPFDSCHLNSLRTYAHRGGQGYVLIIDIPKAIIRQATKECEEDFESGGVPDIGKYVCKEEVLSKDPYFMNGRKALDPNYIVGALEQITNRWIPNPNFAKI